MFKSKYIKSTSKRWIDLEGRQFGDLTVLGFMPSKKWECICKCGVVKEVSTNHLNSGDTKSCGCLLSKVLKLRNTTHNKRRTKEYNIYFHMRGRCLLFTNKDYPNYGGRGIKICDRWLNSFENFYEDMGDCPKEYSIDRKDVNGDYSPENCRWASRKIQSRNKRNNIYISLYGDKKLLIDICEEFNFSYESLRKILSNKSEIEKELYVLEKIKSKNL